jgi:hypothetical protein
LSKYTGSTNASDEACPLDKRLGNLPALIEACESAGRNGPKPLPLPHQIHYPKLHGIKSRRAKRRGIAKALTPCGAWCCVTGAISNYEL